MTDPERCIEWCKEHNLLSSKTCVEKWSVGKESASGDGFVLRCSKGICCYQYGFLQTKEFMYNEVGTRAEILAGKQLTSSCRPWLKNIT